YYSTKPDIPVANLTYKITSFDFKQSFDYLGLFQSLAPIFSQVQGSFSSNMNINTTIQPDLSPNMNSLSGIAGFNINHAFVKNVEVFKKITALTNLEGLDNIELNNISINTVVKDGKVLIEPFELPVKDMKLTIGGAQGLDKSLDYDIAIDIPWDKLGKASTMTNSLLAKNPIPGLNGLHPDVIRFNFDVGGNANSPTVKMLKPSAAIGGQSVKEAMKESFTNQIKNSFLGNNTSDSTTSNKSVKEQLKDNFLSGGNNNDSVKTTPTEQIKQGIKGLFKNK
ncbi:MAG: hypothetical protein KC414_08255, partial [Romboutsia sp.]|nr:hypothetical protein [Romboutsia sp.]